MSTAEWIGFGGVFVLLLAFVLNLVGLIGRRSYWYRGLNALGAAAAGYAAYLIGFLPFVILEWT